MDARLRMRHVPPGEYLAVSGLELIAGYALAPWCYVTNVNARAGQYRDDQEAASHWGYLPEGGTLITASGLFYLQAGMYFATPGPIIIKGGRALLVSLTGSRCLFTVGGPLEPQGRLSYIDGCTDTLLVPPPMKGDPCLNHLHFPPHIRQTMHTHPSLRAGMVARGRGRAIMPNGEELPLEPGSVWLLPTNGPHCFYTDSEPMDVVAWHPDTDTGPTDQDHPMLNRTIVDGQSARHRNDLHTRPGSLARPTPTPTSTTSTATSK